MRSNPPETSTARAWRGIAGGLHGTVLALAGLVWLASAPGTALAGPGVPGPGGYYVSLGSARITTLHAVDDAGERVESDTHFESERHQVYSGFGVGYGLSGTIGIPVVVVRRVDDASGERYRTTGVGDLLVGARYGARFDQISFALISQAKLPIYNLWSTDQDVELDDAFPDTGSGQVDLTLAFSLGTMQPLGRWSYLISADLGYRFRTEWYPGGSSKSDRVYADGVPWNVTAGVIPRRQGKAMGQWTLTGEGIRNALPDAETPQYVKLSTTIQFPLWRARWDRQDLIVRNVNLRFGGGVTPFARRASVGWFVNGGVTIARWVDLYERRRARESGRGL